MKQNSPLESFFFLKSNFFLFDEKALKVISLVDVSPSKTTVFSYQFHNRMNCSYFILVANSCFDVCLTISFSLFGYVPTIKWEQGCHLAYLSSSQDKTKQG